jgi:hypothetical protein
MVLGENRDGITTWPLKQARQADATMNRLSFPVRVAPELVLDVVKGAIVLFSKLLGPRL